jgi:hypothetical protein
LSLLASCSEPARATSLEEIESNRLAVFSGSSGSARDGRSASSLLNSVFGARGDAARYLVSHEVQGDEPTEPRGDNLVLIGKRRRLVAALVRPGERELDVHVVPEH